MGESCDVLYVIFDLLDDACYILYVLFDLVDDPCDGGVVVHVPARIDSPRYPRHYPPNAWCGWQIHSQPDTIVSIRILSNVVYPLSTRGTYARTKNYSNK